MRRMEAFRKVLRTSSVGIGTVLPSFGVGYAMQAVSALLRFEPRAVRHQNVVETSRALFGKSDWRSEENEREEETAS